MYTAFPCSLLFTQLHHFLGCSGKCNKHGSANVCIIVWETFTESSLFVTLQFWYIPGLIRFSVLFVCVWGAVNSGGTLRFCSECFESRKKVFTQLFICAYYVEVSHFGFFFFWVRRSKLSVFVDWLLLINMGTVRGRELLTVNILYFLHKDLICEYIFGLGELYVLSFAPFIEFTVITELYPWTQI